MREIYTKFIIGDIWINNKNCKVKILEVDDIDVWVLCLTNGRQMFINKEDLAEYYILHEKVK